ncbi:ubiquitin domain-containing protein UBFD1 isoform X2 [Histomonas meleagridis]|uniref:ubiquitin domain-containing protein UBFD1 isoform X2 n=1 Tax=Histomonas meleagridis TaxID=135588 RepID=UPI0035595FB1|nr:ubiquitin domain-containing protein UBFD1 isoform X2 [Histomonas meleagridis]KAH0796453.1 ubiquitin domain-containing protein UBFD1 isoform X2 [Histomonas meleagridis]
MQVHLKFQSSTHDILLPEKADVRYLQDEIAKLLRIPIQRQKIIFRGKPLNKSTEELSTLNVPNGAKLLLLETKDCTTNQQKSSPSVYVFTPPSTKLDEEILKMGPPKDAIKSFSNVNCETLPKEPFHIRTKNGDALLSFETEALFIRCGDSYERIFYSDIVGCRCIKSNENNYFALCIATKDEAYEFYFLPNQYLNVISRIVQSRGY